MVTIGLYRGEQECAAAAAADGRLIGAVHYTGTTGADANDLALKVVRDTLEVSGTPAADVQELTVVNTSGVPFTAALPVQPGTVTVVAASLASAAQLRGYPGAGVILTLEDGGEAVLFGKDGPALTQGRPFPGGWDLMQGAQAVAEALGCAGSPPIAALEAIAALKPTATMVSSGTLASDFTIEAARAAVANARASCPELGGPASIHVEVQSARSALATMTLEAMAATLASRLKSASVAEESFVGVTGTAFASPAFSNRLAQHYPSCVVAPVPEPIGGALGAALLPWVETEPVTSLALGHCLSEQEIKDTLENCRLDYVYEPDWVKLFDRVSTLMSSGALVGWFQGRRDFGYRSAGSRSVLADPSHRYVRDNVNVFLLRRDAYSTLPISVAGEECTAAGGYMSDASSRRFSHASDRLGRVLQHAGCPAPELNRLLAVHKARTGVTGLVNVALANDRGLVHHAREAVSTAFASAIDVLVLGRFLVSKDYWLIRGR